MFSLILLLQHKFVMNVSSVAEVHPSIELVPNRFFHRKIETKQFYHCST